MPTKILAIDDSKTMRLAVKITFAAEDADVTSVSKGSDAVARAKQLLPDVILVDAALGEGEPTGYEVCRALKSDPETRDVPVLVMVSNQSGADAAQLEAVGADGFVNKPFDTQELIDKVTTASGGQVRTAATAPSARPAAATPPAATPAPAPSTPAVPAAARPAAAKPAPKPAVPAAAAPRPASPAVPKPAATPKPAPAPSRPAASSGPIPIAVPIPFTAADAPTSGMLARLATAAAGSGAGGADLDPKVAEALVALSREVIESVVWEVVPELAEEMIKKQEQTA